MSQRRGWSTRPTLVLGVVLVGCTCAVGDPIPSHAQVNSLDEDFPVSTLAAAGQPDPFSGQMSVRLPIEVPPGRQGLQPNLDLVYRSAGANGWVGVGWKLELGSIERRKRADLSGGSYGASTPLLVDFNGNDYTFRLGGVTQELVQVSSGAGYTEYRTKLEGRFTRFRQYTSSPDDGRPYWSATDREGRTYTFGKTRTARLVSPGAACAGFDYSQTFDWYLERLEDAQGNYFTATYSNAPDPTIPGTCGVTYLSQIAYSGHQASGLAPTTMIQMYFETRADAPTIRFPGTTYQVTNALRLSKIAVWANTDLTRTCGIGEPPPCQPGSLVSLYVLTYDTSTGRSRLKTLQRVGKDVTVNRFQQIGSGIWVTLFDSDGLKAPAWTLTYQNPTQGMPDLLTTVTNGLGGTTTVSYTPVTPTNAPTGFVVPTVGSLTLNDGNTPAVVSTSTFSYTGGYWNTTDKEYRGFSTATLTGPAGPDGLQQQTMVEFHQGNDVAVGVNNPADPIGYTKGKPFRTTVTDTATPTPKQYSKTETLYAVDSAPLGTPRFHPPQQVDTWIGSTATTRHATTTSAFDPVGNLQREERDADVSLTTDDRTIVRTYSPPGDPWIAGLITQETVHQGLGASLTQVAQTTFYYDTGTGCPAGGVTLGNDNQVPTLGTLTKVARWINVPVGAAPSTTRLVYDALGNVTCVMDPNQKKTQIAYDTRLKTLPVTVTNPLGHQTTTVYSYVNDGTTGPTPPPGSDPGAYARVKTVTDPNTFVVTNTYDALGRVLTQQLPASLGSYTTVYALGPNLPAQDQAQPVGKQYVQVTDPVGLVTKTFFDGQERPIRTETTGPKNAQGTLQTIVTQTTYEGRGGVNRRSLPYFDAVGAQPPGWTAFTYDVLGRPTAVDRQNASQQTEATALACYDDDQGITVTRAPNQRRRRETRDLLARIVTIEEYAAPVSVCDTAVGTPTATTTYGYDVLDHLTTLTDAGTTGTGGAVTTVQVDSLSRPVDLHDPDVGHWRFEYDAAGNLTQQTDAKSQILYLGYDDLNRLTRKGYGTPGGTDVTYTYDQVTLSGTATHGRGRLTTATDSAGSRAFFYDALGRTIRTDQTVSGTVSTTQQAFDGIGRRTAVTYPNSLVVKYDYDGGPWLSLVYEGPTPQAPTLAYAQYAGYTAVGQPGSVTFGNGVTTSLTYSQGSNPTCTPATLWLCTLQTTQGATLLQTLTYGYDPAGNVTAITDPLQGTQTFGYDGLERLTSATGPWGSHTYTYLPNGNLQTNPLLGTYTYNAHTQPGNRPLPHGVKNTGIGQPDFTYDDNGNLTVGAGRTLTYDFENRLRSVTVGPATTTLGVDGDGTRVTQTVTVGGMSRTTTYIGDFYVCDPAGASGCCVNYIFAGDQRIAAKRTDTGAVTYVHGDHLGSTSVVTDGSGNKIEGLAYYPFGATRVNTPGTAGSPLTDTPYKYTGQELDAYTGLYYYRARYYDPVLGRFIQPDPIVPDLYDPQSLNPYSYVLNNPLRYTDPSGYQAGEFCECGITPPVAADLLNSLVQLGVQNRAQPFQASPFLYSVVNQQQPVQPQNQPVGVFQPSLGREFSSTSAQTSRLVGSQINEYNTSLAAALVGTLPPAAGAGVVAKAVKTAPVVTVRGMQGLTLRPDVVLSGGRSGQFVKNLTGPPSSVLRGGGERIFVTNEEGQVILDVTKNRVKPVTPGQGFGPKRAPTPEEADLLQKMLGGG